MTTVLAHLAAGVMVADSKTTDGDTKWTETKVRRIKGALYGVAGNSADGFAFWQWIEKGGKHPSLKADFSGLELSAAGLALYGSDGIRTPIDSPCMGIGTGGKAAMAVVLAGHSPQEAVEIACRVDNASEPPIQVFRLNEG